MIMRLPIDPRDDGVPLTPDGGGFSERRPGRATGAAVLLMVIGVLGILYSWVLLSEISDATDHGETVNSALAAVAYAQLALSAAQIVSGIFVLPGRNWARILGILLTSLNLVGGVVTLFSGSPLAFVGIAINIALIGMLTRPDVREWCGG